MTINNGQFQSNAHFAISSWNKAGGDLLPQFPTMESAVCLKAGAKGEARVTGH